MCSLPAIRTRPSVPGKRASPAKAGAVNAAGENVAMPKRLRRRLRKRAVFHPHHERHVGPHGARAERDFEVSRVAVRQHHDGRRMRDVAQREHVFVRRIAGQQIEAALARAPHERRVGMRIDHDDVFAGFDQQIHDGAADASAAAHDEVAARRECGANLAARSTARA